MMTGAEAARCDHGNVASCAWCCVRKQGDELLRLRAALGDIARMGAGEAEMLAAERAKRALCGDHHAGAE